MKGFTERSSFLRGKLSRASSAFRFGVAFEEVVGDIHIIQERSMDTRVTDVCSDIPWSRELSRACPSSAPSSCYQSPLRQQLPVVFAETRRPVSAAILELFNSGHINVSVYTEAAAAAN